MNIKLTVLLLFSLCIHYELTYSQVKGQDSDVKSDDKSKTKKDTVVFRMHVFNLVDDHTRKIEVKQDTLIGDFENYNPVYKNSLSAQTLGNFGSSYQSNDFFQRNNNPEDFLFLNNHKAYGLWPNDVRFYNNTKPFTLLEYGQWFANKPKGETWLKVFHTQNINPNLNFGFSYNSIGSQGKYLNQEDKDNDLHFFLSYNVDRYDMWLAIGQNKFTNQENGGFPNPKDIENPDLKPENIAVWLNGASDVTKNSFIMVSHQYKFGKWVKAQAKDVSYQKFIPRFALMHTLEISTNSRNFSETDPNPYFQYSDARGKVYFYGEGNTPLINGGMGIKPATQDNSGQNRITNKFFLKLPEAPDRKYTFGKQAYIGNDIISDYYSRAQLIFTPGVWMPPLGLTQSHGLTNTYVGGSIFRTEGKFWNWSTSGRYYIQGYKFGDFDLNGKISKPIRTARDTSFFAVNASMTNTTPDYFYNHYYSNHYKWDNNFNRIYSLKMGASYENPKWNFKAGFKYTIITNYVYWSEQVLPAQANSEFSVAQAFLNKNFKLGVLNIDNWVVYQKTTTAKYLHVPEIMARNCIYLTGTYAKVLHFQFGVDTRYESKYYADYYSPALGMYYVQQNEQIGDYPWMDVFVNLKLKRTRFYVKYSNLGATLLKSGYYSTPNYAGQPALLGFGLSWTFYD
jgi:hypothetical protein